MLKDSLFFIIKQLDLVSLLYYTNNLNYKYKKYIIFKLNFI
jgi:hypothetical protein